MPYTWFLKCFSQFQSIAHTDTYGNVFWSHCEDPTTETRLIKRALRVRGLWKVAKVLNAGQAEWMHIGLITRTHPYRVLENGQRSSHTSVTDFMKWPLKEKRERGIGLLSFLSFSVMKVWWFHLREAGNKDTWCVVGATPRCGHTHFSAGVWKCHFGCYLKKKREKERESSLKRLEPTGPSG